MSSASVKSLLRVSLLVLVIFATLIITPLSAAAESGTVSGRPANPDPLNSRTKSIFIKSVNPGDSVKDAVKVLNNTDERQTILVYATDSVASSGGAFACAQAVDPVKAAGSWITVSKPSVEVNANSSVDVPFTITVPKDAEPGEQNGCIVLQKDTEADFQGGIGLSFRTAIRVALLVNGDIHKELSLLDLIITQSSEKIILTPSVRNTGNVSLDAEVKTLVETIFGTPVLTSTGTYPVLRDQLTEWNIEVDRPLWGGFYKASYAISYDSTDNFLNTSSPEEITTLHGQEKWFFVWPRGVALLFDLLIVSIFVVVGFLVYKLIKRRAVLKSQWVSHTVSTTDDLPTLATKHKTTWKLLAKMNDIKAPYTLSPGQTIKVPSAVPSRTKNIRKK